MDSMHQSLVTGEQMPVRIVLPLILMHRLEVSNDAVSPASQRRHINSRAPAGN